MLQLLNRFRRSVGAGFSMRLLHVGQRVTLADMNGCMAESRENVRRGRVIGFVKKPVYDGNRVEPIYTFARIQLEDGAVVERMTEPRLWTKFEGLLEYRD